MLTPSLDSYFSEVSAYVLLKEAANSSFKGKKYENLAFLGYFSEAKAKEFNQNIEVPAIDLALL